MKWNEKNYFTKLTCMARKENFWKSIDYFISWHYLEIKIKNCVEDLWFYCSQNFRYENPKISKGNHCLWWDNQGIKTKTNIACSKVSISFFPVIAQLFGCLPQIWLLVFFCNFVLSFIVHCLYLIYGKQLNPIPRRNPHSLSI